MYRIQRIGDEPARRRRRAWIAGSVTGIGVTAAGVLAPSTEPEAVGVALAVLGGALAGLLGGALATRATRRH